MCPNEQETREIYRNTARDEATTARTHERFEVKPGLADEDQPIWRPAETNPEPRPVEPTLDADPGTPPAQQ